MKIRVTEEGVLIPRELLEGMEEVDIRKEDNVILVTPVANSSDPIFELGKYPISIELTDASTDHDHYIYGHD